MEISIGVPITLFSLSPLATSQHLLSKEAVAEPRWRSSRRPLQRRKRKWCSSAVWVWGDMYFRRIYPLGMEFRLWFGNGHHLGLTPGIWCDGSGSKSLFMVNASKLRLSLVAPPCSEASASPAVPRGEPQAKQPDPRPTAFSRGLAWFGPYPKSGYPFVQQLFTVHFCLAQSRAWYL